MRFLIAMSLLWLSGCTYMSARVETKVDGEVIAKARYANLMQDRSWVYNPVTGVFEFKSSNEPVQVIIQSAIPLAKTVTVP